MTRTPSRSASARLALTLVALVALAALAPASAIAQSETPIAASETATPNQSPAPVATAGPGQSAEPGEPPMERALPCPSDDPAAIGTCLAVATPIEPTEGLIDPQPVPFDHIVVGPDGRTLTVYFWMGVQECNGLDSVVVEQVDGAIEVTVLTGIPEEAIARSCIAIAQLYSTVVTLDEPLIVAGTEA